MKTLLHLQAKCARRHIPEAEVCTNITYRSDLLGAKTLANRAAQNLHKTVKFVAHGESLKHTQREICGARDSLKHTQREICGARDSLKHTQREICGARRESKAHTA